jgi:hypothetical protein
MEKGMRKRREASSMYDLVSAWEKSDLSQQAFCQTHEIPVAVFAYWRRRHKRSEAGEMRAAGFSEVCLPGTGSSGGIFARIRFANGVELELEQRVESAWIKDLVQ